MKPILISSTIALVIGFAGGWAIKSANQELESFSPDKVIANVQPPKPREGSPPAIPPRNIPDDTAGSKPPRTRPSLTPPARLPETSDAEVRAKWMRLSEVLDLTAEQSKVIEAVIAESHPDQTGETSIQDAIRAAGERLEADMLSALNPEQQQAFKELQERSRKNMIESKAQKHLAEELGGLDLSPAQREQALDLIRSRVEEKTASVPDSARLLLTGSVLPVGDKARIDEDALLILDLVAETTPQGQPSSFEALASRRKSEIEARMSQFEGILTPAQMAQYRLGMEENLANLEKISAPR